MTKFWWVNQGKTYEVEVTGGFLWSPKTNRNKAKNQFYENMRLVKPGDIVFSVCDGFIMALGVVTSGAESALKPDFGKAGEEWLQEGWSVAVEFKELEKPVRLKDYVQILISCLPKKYSPIRPDGIANQCYLAELPDELASRLIHIIGDQYERVVEKLSADVNTAALEDAQLQIIEERTDIGSTEKEQLVKARRGQGIFRKRVMQNEKTCRVTGVSDPKYRVASHLKPWAVSSDEERLDGNNGLGLTWNADHLLDNGIISFTDSGDILISPQSKQKDLDALGIPSGLNVGVFNEKQAYYLRYHREMVFKSGSLK